jgi:uncharacterized protein (DUF1501 family)
MNPQQHLGPQLSRRSALLGLTSAYAVGRSSLALAATATEQRFIVVILRGALDGMSAVQPYGDPAFTSLRGPLALPPPGNQGGVLDLGGFYGLHPSLVNLHAMYAGGQALVVHAVAGHYRSRSHFEAQDYLESGADQRLMSGWLNRAVGAMPAAAGHELALSVGLSAPLMLRGPAPVEAWAPDHFAQPEADLYARLIGISQHDPVIGPALAEGVRQRGLSGTAIGASAPDPKHDHDFQALAAAAGRLLAVPAGPRVAVLEIGGWDTHAAQVRRLNTQLKQLDEGLGALRMALADAWRHTMVVAVTEFGRTARVNGTQGTDHGTAGAAFVLGGAVAGGRVLADWPGVGSGRLFEDRDLEPTLDVRALLKGALADHLGLSLASLDAVFPGSTQVTPIHGLCAT